MSEHIPAWKRAGLSQQKSKESYDPVKAGLKRTENGEDTGPKKPPKRVKVPKAERKPPPESDQLAYLRQYHEDKANWKFSKQKQNWILKNIFTVEEKYEAALIEYVASIQGASKDRVVEDCEKLIKEWNEYITNEHENKPTETAEKSDSKPESTETDAKNADESEPQTEAGDGKDAQPKPKGILKNKQPEAQPEGPAPPKEATAVRAQKIVEAVTGTKPELEYVE